MSSQTLNRLCKWRAIFAGWQLGPRVNEDPEAQAVRDHREATLLLRVEVSALAVLLQEKGIITREEFQRQGDEEAEHLMRELEAIFPGAKATDEGMQITTAL